MHAPRYHLLHHLRAAAKRDAVHADAGELLQLPRQNLLCRGGADRRIGELARMHFGVFEEGVEVARRNGIGECQAVVVLGDERDRRNVSELEAGILIDGGVDRLEMGAEEERVAIARLRQHVARRDHPRRRRLVLHDDALAERFAELVRNKPPGNVGRPARAEADHQPDGPRGISFLGVRGAGGEHQHQKRATEG